MTRTVAIVFSARHRPGGGLAGQERLGLDGTTGDGLRREVEADLVLGRTAGTEVGLTDQATFGNLALSTNDCVYASVSLETAAGPTPPSTTHCFRGKTFVQ